MSGFHSIKRRIRALTNFPRYGPVGMHDPQQQVDVWLHRDGEVKNVTRNNVVAALRPFTIGIMFERAGAEAADRPATLCVQERGGERLLGSISLRPVRSIELPGHDLPGHRFCLFETDACRNRSVGPLRIALYNAREKWRADMRQRKNPYNFRMTPPDLLCSHVFYMCPRPVVLVTVEHEGSSNMFPMDLIGPTDSPWFSMALRSTSPAVKLMRESRRMALASLPLAFKAEAYEMGKHHKKTSINWADLPFPTAPSPLYGLPVMEAALRVREVRVEEVHEIGSHHLFITSIERETVAKPVAAGVDRRQLFHWFSSHKDYLKHEDRNEPSKLAAISDACL